MRITERQGKLLGAAAVVVVALGLRLAYWAEIRGTPLGTWERWDQTDMATYLKQGERLASGDWLGRAPYHPYHVWQEEAGSEEEWLRWYPRGSFHQAPLLSYALAAASKVSARFTDRVKLLQILLGAVSCLLIAAVARRVGGDATGLVAGLIAALYGPLLYLEPQILREGPAIFGFALLLWLLVRYVESEDPETTHAWVRPAEIGLLLGVYSMFHENALVLAAGATIVVGTRAARRSWRQAALALAALAVGHGVGFAPLLARNLAVGAPPFSTSSQVALNLAIANMSSASAGGAFFSIPGPQLKTIMESSGGSVPGVVREIWRTYEGQRILLPWNVLRRFAVLWADVEISDNTSFDFYRREVRALRASLSFAWIFAPAATVLLLLAGTGLRRRSLAANGEIGEPAGTGVLRRAWEEHKAAHLTVLVFAPLQLGALLLVLPQARFRLFLVPICTVYAALFAVIACRWLRGGRIRPLLGAGALLLTLVALQRVLSWPLRAVVQRPVDYAVAAEMSRSGGDVERAVGYFRDGIAACPRDVEIRLEFARVLAGVGRFAAGIEQLEAARALQPDILGLDDLIAKLRQAEAAGPSPTGPAPGPP